MVSDSTIVLIVIIVAIFAITLVGVIIYLKNNNITIGKFISHTQKRNNKQNNDYSYTHKDRDMMLLIHELSTIYSNIDDYLNNKH